MSVLFRAQFEIIKHYTVHCWNQYVILTRPVEMETTMHGNLVTY